MRFRRPSGFWFLIAAVLVVLAGYTVWYYTRPENPVRAYQRAQEAWVAEDYNALYDRLDAESQRQLDIAYPLLMAAEVKKEPSVEPGEAHHFHHLRGKDLFAEVSKRGYSLSALQWAKIVSVEEGPYRAVLHVEGPQFKDQPTTGVVVMTREGESWKLAATELTQ